MTYTNLRYSSPWRADTFLSQRLLPRRIRPWVVDRGSLTAALTKLSNGEFQVNVLDQRIAIPCWHEQRKLKQPLSHAAMIRQVELKIYGEAVVYARSIIPLALAFKGRTGLAHLGRTPLGHLLFKDGKIRVSKREFADVRIDNTAIYARRTPYDYQDSRILVAEFFLPALGKWL